MIVPVLTTKNLSWDKATRVLAGEVSDHPSLRRVWPSTVIVRSEKTGRAPRFSFEGFDYTGHGEDREIAGARYHAADVNVSLLLIND